MSQVTAECRSQDNRPAIIFEAGFYPAWATPAPNDRRLVSPITSKRAVDPWSVDASSRLVIFSGVNQKLAGCAVVREDIVGDDDVVVRVPTGEVTSSVLVLEDVEPVVLTHAVHNRDMGGIDGLRHHFLGAALGDFLGYLGKLLADGAIDGRPVGVVLDVRARGERIGVLERSWRLCPGAFEMRGGLWTCDSMVFSLAKWLRRTRRSRGDGGGEAEVRRGDLAGCVVASALPEDVWSSAAPNTAGDAEGVMAMKFKG